MTIFYAHDHTKFWLRATIQYGIDINSTNILDQNPIGVQANYSANEKLKLKIRSKFNSP